MAEILVKARDNTHPDPLVDATGCYKIGMPVVVMPDGHQWGNEERLPSFWVIKIPGLSVDKVRQFTEANVEQIGTGHHGQPLMKRNGRRLWKWFVNELPPAVVTLLNTNGTITIGPSGDLDWQTARAYLRNLRDNSTAPLVL